MYIQIIGQKGLHEGALNRLPGEMSLGQGVNVLLLLKDIDFALNGRGIEMKAIGQATEVHGHHPLVENSQFRIIPTSMRRNMHEGGEGPRGDHCRRDVKGASEAELWSHGHDGACRWRVRRRSDREGENSASHGRQSIRRGPMNRLRLLAADKHRDWHSAGVVSGSRVLRRGRAKGEDPGRGSGGRRESWYFRRRRLAV